MNFFDEIKRFYLTFCFYVGVVMTLISPGTWIWKCFGERKGKVRLINRDLICDWKTLIDEGKSFQPLDQFTTTLSPFVPLFLIDNPRQWKSRRDLFRYGNPHLDQRIDQLTFDVPLPSHKGDYLWIIFPIVFRYSFELIFQRKISEDEFNRIYPGLVDINRMLKRISSRPNEIYRSNFYKEILRLINDKSDGFLFVQNENFYHLNEIDQVSSVGEDFLTTLSVQCTDLVCHLLILYSDYENEFRMNFDRCFDETLRLYPLTDIWVRQSKDKKNNWIGSLVQLNRNGWTKPDDFCPQRWSNKTIDHPPLLSWGFDIRRCPAQQIATKLTKKLFLSFVDPEHFWICKAKNFHHERTFPYGCQLWIDYGIKPRHAQQWIYPNQFQMKVKRWFHEKIRMIDQYEFN